MNRESKPVSWLEKWHVAPSGSGIYGFLDGIRGIAILMVVACHFLYVNPAAEKPIRFVFGIFEAGTYGVTVFFALSGFLISLPFWKLKKEGRLPALKRYAARRFWKIIPPLFLSIVILTPLYILLRGDAMLYLTTALKWLTGYAFFAPVSGKLNPVMWSLIVETHFYIALPLVFVLLKKCGYRTTLVLTFLLFLLVPLAARIIQHQAGTGFSLHPLIQVRFPSKLDPFAIGILIAGLHQLGSLPKTLVRNAYLGLFGILAALLLVAWNKVSPGFYFSNFWEFINMLVIASTGLLLSFIGDPENAARWFLDNSILRWLGLISYEWYLFHQVAFFFTWKFLGEADGDPKIYAARILIPAIVSLGLASLVYRFFSLPILRKTR